MAIFQLSFNIKYVWLHILKHKICRSFAVERQWCKAWLRTVTAVLVKDVL